MVLSIFSPLPFSLIKTFVETSFFVKQKNVYIQSLRYSPIIEYNNRSKVKCKTYKKQGLNATYLCISFRVCSYHNNDQYPLYLLSEILSGTFSSLLYNLLREENGLTYSSYSEVNFYKYFGDLSIYVILHPSKLLKNGTKKGVLPLVIQLLNELYEKGVEKQIFNIIKSYIKGQFLIESEDSNNPCEYNGKNMLLDCEYTSFTKLYSTHFSSLQKETIDTIIKKYFKKSNMCCCLLGSYIPSLSIFEKECNNFVG
jgi:predicted Zn-dependent peptidase